jgi:hypothetical protein
MRTPIVGVVDIEWLRRANYPEMEDDLDGFGGVKYLSIVCEPEINAS